MYFQHVPLFWNVADPVKPLKSYSAQINFDITIEMVRVRRCMANTSCNWCQKKKDKLNFCNKKNNFLKYIITVFQKN